MNKEYQSSVYSNDELNEEAKSLPENIQSNYLDKENDVLDQSEIEDAVDMRKYFLERLMNAWSEYNKLLFEITDIESERESLMKIEVKQIFSYFSSKATEKF